MPYSYALGMAPVVELIGRCPGLVLAVYAHPGYRAESGADIFEMCEARGLKCETNQKIFNIAANKENIYVLGVFQKAGGCLSPARPHAVFVNPADAGNLGANVRTCLGFGIRDIAIIKPGADIYSPKAVRASMGAIFHANASGFASYQEYAEAYPGYERFYFMLNGEAEIGSIAGVRGDTFALVFGNEATGLPDEFRGYGGRSVRIAHGGEIDSLNLTVAVGVAAHAFYKLRR